MFRAMLWYCFQLTPAKMVTSMAKSAKGHTDPASQIEVQKSAIIKALTIQCHPRALHQSKLVVYLDYLAQLVLILGLPM